MSSNILSDYKEAIRSTGSWQWRTKDKPDWKAPGIPGFEAIPCNRIGLLKTP